LKVHLVSYYKTQWNATHQESPALLFLEGLNEAQGMEQGEYWSKHKYQEGTTVSQFIFQIQMVPNDI
jgi:hypothetical protein